MRQSWHSLREYEALRAMIISGTTISAARQLGISQSAVSRSIANLESRIGYTLFSRNGGRLEPTQEALNLNQNLDPIFQALAKIEGKSTDSEEVETLRIAAPPTLAHLFLQSRITSFMEIQPSYRILFEICDSDALLSNVADEIIDIGVSDLRFQHAGVRSTPFRRSKLVCLLPQDSPLCSRDVISVDDLTDVPIVASVKRHSVRRAVDQMFAKAGIKPKIVVETATALASFEFVRSGVGAAIISPFPLVLTNPEGVCIRPIDLDLQITTSFLTPAGKALNAGARAFMRLVRTSIREDAWSQPIV